MIEKIIKEIGIQETWRNIEEQRDCDISIWLLWWGVQRSLNKMIMEIVWKNIEELNLIESKGGNK